MTREADVPPDRSDEAAASQQALEEAALRYLQAHTDWSDAPLLLEGFVIMIQGREMSLEGANRSTNIWATPDNQPVVMTLGLADMLGKNVDMWFRSGDTRD